MTKNEKIKNYKIEFFNNCPKAIITKIDNNKPFNINFIKFLKMGYIPLFTGVCGNNEAIMLIKKQAIEL